MKWCLGVFVGGLVLASGCGGGGGNSSIAEQEQQIGMVTTRAAGAVPAPVVMTGAKATVTGLAGASFSLARINLPAPTQLNREDVLATTQIAFSRFGRPWIHEVSTGYSYPVNPTAIPYLLDSPPSITPTGDRVISSEWDTSDYYQLFSTLIDGTGRTRLTTSVDATYPAVSPDGTKVAFARYYNGVSQIWTVPVGGGTPTRLTNEGQDCIAPQWSPDGTKIGFIRDAAPFRDLFVMNANGSSVTQMIARPTSDTTYIGFDWAPWGNEIAALYVTSAGINTIATGLVGKWFGPPIYTTSESMNGVTWSPDGSRIAFTKGAGSTANIYSIAATGGGTPTKMSSIGDVGAPNWGFYVRQRTMIGNGGGMTGAGAGFMFAQVGQRIPAFCVFDATTRSSATIETQNAGTGEPHLVATIKADAITMFRYANHLFGPFTSVVSNGSTISGALVTFDGNTGLITNVIPFVGTSPKSVAKLQYEGQFLGVWNDQGKQVAGAGSRLVIDSRTGQVRL